MRTLEQEKRWRYVREILAEVIRDVWHKCRVTEPGGQWLGDYFLEQADSILALPEIEVRVARKRRNDHKN